MKWIFVCLTALLPGLVQAQYQFPELSPKGSIEQRVGFTTIRVEYERPSVKGREIFGSLVPYGKLWRTGAGGCTTIQFSAAVSIGNKKIEAGTYSLFTIPGVKDWTIILNRDATLYGLDNYDSVKDILRLTLKPANTSQLFETLTIGIDMVSNNAELYIAWEHTRIHFLIQTSTDEMVLKHIEDSLLSGKSNDWNDYTGAASYLLQNHRDLNQALILVNKAIEHHGELYSYDLKVSVLEKLKNYPAAIGAAYDGLEYIREFGQKLGYEPIETVQLKATIKRLEAMVKQ